MREKAEVAVVGLLNTSHTAYFAQLKRVKSLSIEAGQQQKTKMSSYYTNIFQFQVFIRFLS